MANNTSETETNGRKLSDLRVFELKAELTKRNEETQGVKAVLLSKLTHALEKEGHNPEEYLFMIESPKKTGSKRTKMSAEDSDASEVPNDCQEMNDSLDGSGNENFGNQSVSEKTGYEASDIIEDALQLAVDDELKEDREDIMIDSKQSSKVVINRSNNEENSQKYTEDSLPEQTTPLLSPPKPETAPVVAPLTIEDKISMDTLKHRNAAADDSSMIVNLDDSQSDLLDADLDVSNNSNENHSKDNNDLKSIRKSNNQTNTNSDSKSESGNENKTSNIEESDNNSAKDLNKLSEKDSSKSKSSSVVQKENKLKNKDSKNPSAAQKGQTNSNGRNIWVSGLPQNTKASELQTIFSKHGKVVSAKIIKNARMSGSRCYGFITMENSEQVSKCIAQLNKTELHGRTVALSRNRPQESTSKPTVAKNKPNSAKRDINKKGSNNKSNESKESDSKETKAEEKSEENTKSKASEDNPKHPNKGSTSESGSNKGSDTKDKVRRDPIRAPIRDRPVHPSVPFRRPMIPFRRPMPLRRPFPQTNTSIRGFHSRGGRGFHSRGGMRPVLPIKRHDIDRHLRERERERQIREERRRREEMMRVDIEREERIRFEREKERLKLERMKLEREKAEFFKIEKERARLERERIEREREELRRRQQTQTILQHRVEDSRSRSAMVSATLNKRPFDSRDIRGTDSYWEDRKRLTQMQRMDSHLMPGRQSYIESSPSVGNRHSIPHSYDTRNESYKRSTRLDLPLTSRSEFDPRRHESRHGIGHDRDDRKGGSGPSYYRGDSTRGGSRDRRIGGSQREDWKTSHDSRRSDRYSDKPMTGGSTAGFRGYGGDSRGWTDRSSNSMNKASYGSGGMSGGQQWNPSSGDRWNSAISSSGDSRSRGQTSLNASMLSTNNSSIADLFGSPNPMPALSMNMSHSMGGSAGNNISSGDRPYLHSNRRF